MMATKTLERIKNAALKATTEKQREEETLDYICEVLRDVAKRKGLGLAMLLAAILAQCYRDQEADMANRGKRVVVQWAKATMEVLDMAGELHESWLGVPKMKKVLKKLD
jgi:hypothetical protein